MTGFIGQSEWALTKFIVDLRDKLIDEISKLADITASYSDRGVANVTVGSSE